METGRLLGLLASASSKNSGVKYVDDVFKSHMYVGASSSQAINNGIDLSTLGGMVWIKRRDSVGENLVIDTVRGVTKNVKLGSLNPEATDATNLLSFNTNGFTVGNATDVNNNTFPYASFTFAKKAKFFDIVTFTGNGSNRAINHNLGIAPGMILIKSLSNTNVWAMYHIGIGNTKFIRFEGTNVAQVDATVWNNTDPTATNFTVGTSAYTNQNGESFVAYLFAHDSGADSIIKCGYFDTDVNGAATVSLGFEPQFLMTRATVAAANSNSLVMDVMRGLQGPTPFADLTNIIYANTTAAETTVSGFNYRVNQDGFEKVAAGGGSNVSTRHVYLAIKRSNRPPVVGTDIYGAIQTNKSIVSSDLTGLNFTPDIALMHPLPGSSGDHLIFDRLRGSDRMIKSSSNVIEAATPGAICDLNRISKGIRWGDYTTYYNGVAHFFARRARAIDAICYTGSVGSIVSGNREYTHSLGIVPELVLIKKRNVASQVIYAGWISGNKEIQMDNVGSASYSLTKIAGATSSKIQVLAGDILDASSTNYVAYLFASKQGVIKIGSYTGNGGSQTIDCGFSAGVRFLLIKRLDNIGDWFIWDTTNGIVSGNDKHQSLNTTANIITADDSIDPASSGFIVNQITDTNINVNTATYLYMAIA